MSDFTYAYLVSVEHSGSTLMACLADGHPRISSVGEFGTPFRPTNKCCCGVTFGECDLYNRWQKEAAAEGLDLTIGSLDINLAPGPGDGRRADLFYHLFPNRALDRMRDLLFPPSSALSRHARDAVERSERLARILCRMEGTDVFFDTTKNPLQVRFLARYLRAPLKVVCMIRDGRGVMNSLIEKEKYPPDKAIAVWLWGIRQLERLQRYVPPQDLRVYRLEDFCGTPAEHLKDLFGFLGVDEGVTPDCSDPSRRHVIGNRMRLSFTGEIRKEEGWRERLPPELIRMFEDRAGAVNRGLGYGD